MVNIEHPCRVNEFISNCLNSYTSWYNPQSRLNLWIYLTYPGIPCWPNRIKSFGFIFTDQDHILIFINKIEEASDYVRACWLAGIRVRQIKLCPWGTIGGPDYSWHWFMYMFFFQNEFIWCVFTCCTTRKTATNDRRYNIWYNYVYTFQFINQQ